MSALSWHGVAWPPALHGVDLEVPTGSLVAVVGPNGAGKSTLLRTALGLVRPAAGEARVGGTPTRRLSARERAGRIGWLPQVLRSAERIPVPEVVATARFRLDEPPSVARGRALDALDAVGAGSLADRTLDTLSGGERQRVALATLRAQDVETWLLDEPANHLDPAVRAHVHGQVVDHWTAGGTAVVVTHDLDGLARHVPPGRANDVAVVGLAGGAVVFRATLADPDLAGRLSQLFGVAVHAVEVAGRTRWLVGGP